MQSSTAVVFRALVMLGCLVAIPLAAVVGKSLPEMVRGLIDGQWPGHSASAYGSLDEAPPFEAARPADSPPAVARGQIGSDWQEIPGQQTRRWPSGADRLTSSPVIAASLQSKVGPVGPFGAVSQSGPNGAVPLATRAVPAHAGLAAVGPDRPRTSVPQPGTAVEPAARDRPTVDRFAFIQDRLRQLGSTYSLLESWGNSEQLYRFYCRVAVGGNPNYTHYFEATDSDSLEAMARVLGKVEAWRAGRR